MGVVRNIADFRREPGKTVHDLGDFAAWQRIAGRCPGCNARRSFLVAFHDDATGQQLKPFTRTLPHFQCNGRRVSRQEAPLAILQAQGGDPD